MKKPPELPSPEQPKSLQKRAKEEMDLWRKRLPYRARAKLNMDRSPWARHGGGMIALGVRHGKTARRNKKLKREREARFKADQAAYEARRTGQVPIED